MRAPTIRRLGVAREPPPHMACAQAHGPGGARAWASGARAACVRAMTKHAIVVTTVLPPAVEARLAERFEVRKADARPVERALIDAAAGAFAVVPSPGDRFDAEAIARLPGSVRLLASYSVGVDHVDVAAAKARRIAVTNTPDVLTEATADLAMHLLLSAARGTSAAEAMLRAGRWRGWAPGQVFGVDLQGKTLGILGLGRIGRAVAARAAAFGMDLAYHDRAGRGDQGGVRAIGDLDAFWSGCDAISLHAPSTPETRGVVNAEAVARMRGGVLLVNTARGDLLDDDAVIAGVLSGRIGGLGLDVFRGEPDFDHRYLDLPRTTLLPHVGSSTAETRLAMGERVLANLTAAASGAPLPNPVG